MNAATTVLRTLARLTGLIQIILGLLFWTGNALNLIVVHIFVGLVLVLTLWGLAILGAFAGVNRGVVALALVWGLIVPIFGLTQSTILPGSLHWIIEVLHLLVGLSAIGQAEGLAKRIKQTTVTALPA